MITDRCSWFKKFALGTISLFIISAILFLPLSASAASLSLREGEENSKITVLQEQLSKKGYLQKEYITGYFGQLTTVAVSDFQRMNDLFVDGIAGPRTLEKLFGSNYESKFNTSGSSSATAGTDEDAAYWAKAREKYPNALLLGDKSKEVEKLQESLKKLGYYKYDNITGYYGVITLQAVRSFQAANGNTVDGIVGNSTLSRLNSKNAVSASKARTTSSSASSTSAASANTSDVDKFIDFLKNQIGKPYVYGAAGPNSFDCSGLVQYAFKQCFGITVPRSSYDQGTYSKWTKISSSSDLQRGDLVFFNTSRTAKSIDHVGVYIGNGQLLHAPGSGKKVCIVTFTANYYQGHFAGGMRAF